MTRELSHVTRSVPSRVPSSVPPVPWPPPLARRRRSQQRRAVPPRPRAGTPCARVRGIVYTSLFRRSTPRPPPGLINYPSYISPRTRARPFELPRASMSTCERDLLRLLAIHRPTAPCRLNCRCDDTPRRARVSLYFTLRTRRNMSYYFGTQPPVVDPLDPTERVFFFFFIFL